MRIVLLFTLAFTHSLVRAECSYTGDVPLIEAKPLVKVAPVYPRRALRRGVEGCVVLGFSLTSSPKNSAGTIPTEMVVLSSSDSGRKTFEKVSKTALSKWLYLSKNDPPTDELSHYATFPFELE